MLLVIDGLERLAERRSRARGARRPRPLRAADHGIVLSAARTWASTSATPRRWAASRPWARRPGLHAGGGGGGAGARGATRSTRAGRRRHRRWVAGVLFEAWRSDDHVAGRRRRGRPAARLPRHADPRAPDAGRARAAGGDLAARRGHRRARRRRSGIAGAGELLVGLRAAHLPVAWARTAAACAATRAFASTSWNACGGGGERARARCARARRAAAQRGAPRGGRRGAPARGRAGRGARARPSGPSPGSSSGWTWRWPSDGCTS